jgi:putative tryptophan/tyrosine transport system substrate-binding protein
MMNRRTFIGTLAVGLLAAPLAAEAQQRPVPRIGFLSGLLAADLALFVDKFRQELRKVGWIEGRNVTFLELRSAEGRNERLPALTADVLKADPTVIVVFSAPATRVLQQATTTIPLVMSAVGDPVEYGLVASLAKPGGNVTGTSYLVNEVAGKLVALLKEAVPAVTSVGVFVNPSNPGGQPYLRAARGVGQTLAVRVQALEVRTLADFEGVFAAIVGEGTEAIILSPEPLAFSQRKRIAEFAAQRRLPLLIHGAATRLDVGGLLSYAAKTGDYPRVVASYVDLILKGSRPADLPIQQPTEFELAVNLKTAKALGLTIPASLLQRADQVIE